MCNLVLIAHHVSVSSHAHVYSIVFLALPIIQLVVQLIRRGVMRVSTLVILIAVVIIQDGRLSNGHADDGASMLVCPSGASVAVAALGPQQHRGNVVDLMSGLSAGALLRDSAPLAPPVARVQDEGEEED